MTVAVPSVLMVCMGNICRSPMAEGLLRWRAEQAGLALLVDSAGTHDYHRGEPPDPRACAVAAQRGLRIDGQRARAVCAADVRRFNHILVADAVCLQRLHSQFGPVAGCELLLPFAGLASPVDVPDPYYGDTRGFEQVFELLDSAMAGVLRRLAKSA